MAKKRRRRRTDKSEITLTRLELPAEDHEAFKSAILAGAEKRVGEGKRALDELVSLFKRSDPLQIVATCASYGLQGVVDSRDGVTSRPSESQLEQFHVELLQAVLLVLPAADWGSLPATPGDAQIAFDRIRDLAETFLASRLLAHEKIENPQDRAAASLQERIRLHTQAVRNWAYFSDVVAISTELYSELDTALVEKGEFLSVPGGAAIGSNREHGQTSRRNVREYGPGVFDRDRPTH